MAVVLAIAVALALAAALALALYGEWRMKQATARFEAVLGPLDLARFLRPGLPDTENAATWLLAGAGAVVLAPEDQEFIGLRRRQTRPWSAEETGRARRLIEVNGRALELLRRSAGCDDSSYELDYLQGPNAEMPPFAELLRAGGLVWMDGRLALVEGDTARLRGDLETLDQLTSSLYRESLLVSSIVAAAADRTYMDLVHQLLTTGVGDHALLGEVKARLEGRDRQAIHLRVLAGEGSLTGTLSNQALIPLLRLLEAAFLDEFSAVGELVSEPWPKIMEASDERASRSFPRSFAVTLYPYLIDSLGKLKVGQSVDQLALEAIRNRQALLSDGAYPPARMSPLVDPYSGREVSVERRADRALVIEAPGALELWRERNPGTSPSGDPHFTWVLPAAP